MTVALTMTGHLEICILISLSSPVEDMATVAIPKEFTLHTYNGRAFWNIVVCRLRKMRPLGVPETLGITYHQVAYRVLVSVDTPEGRLSGLYFAHSQADNRVVSWGGNVASDFKFYPSRLQINAEGTAVSASGRSFSSTINDTFSLRGQCLPQIPALQTDLFPDDETAQKYLKYRPMGLAINKNNDLRIAEVIRNEDAWHEQQFSVKQMQWGLLDSLGQKDLRLEMATWIDPIDYRWRIGRAVPLGR